MEENKINFKVIAFWIAFAAITVCFAIVFCVKIFQVSTFDSMDDVKKANLVISGQITEKEDDIYYVYIYSEKQETNLDKIAEVEPMVFNYFTYAQKHKGETDVRPIYAYNIDKFAVTVEYKTVGEYLSSLNSSIKVANCPILVKISNNSVSTVYSTMTTIESELNTQMNSND